MKRCSICLLDRHLTSEHILPESIGGTLEADIQCQSCNSNLGAELVSGVRTDPSIRLAIRNLRDRLPALYESMESGQPYLATGTSGERLPSVRQKGRYRIKAHKKNDGSIIVETREAARGLRKILLKDGLGAAEVEHALTRFTEAPSNTPVLLSDQTTVVKASHELATEPELSAPLMDNRVIVLFAYNYLCLMLADLVLDDPLDFIRRYIVQREESSGITVDHMTSRKYAPFHRLRVEVTERETAIEIVLVWVAGQSRSL
jgi:uncharacterized membrane protein